ncbi:MAG: hypothetical protein ISS63_01520 [Desulfobacteraceae bacterium]|nr:hypothetical protein [Desulfobacteraceae bacterium]
MIQEQPSSQENVNNLINFTWFYFNDSVEIEVEKSKEGLKITRFETRILDKQEKHRGRVYTLDNKGWVDLRDVGAADKAAIQLVKVQQCQLLVSDT